MKHQTPVPSEIVQRVLRESRIKDIGKASIRESGRIVNTIEQLSGIRFVRMEMGVPGLPASPQGVEAEIEALRRGVAAVYPPIDGIPELKHETSRFLKNFLNISIDPSGCVPTVGSMQGGFTAFLMTSRCFAQRPKTLFLDPGFPVQKQQHQVLGIPFESFDLYQFRGERQNFQKEYTSKKETSPPFSTPTPTTPHGYASPSMSSRSSELLPAVMMC